MARKGASARKTKAKRRGVKRAGKKMMTFDQRVTAVLSRNIEDKYTRTKQEFVPVVAIDLNNLYKWGLFFPSQVGDAGGIWNMGQGVGNETRVGNKIKCKKWLVKGMIQPNLSIDEDVVLSHSQVGYVTVYLGRLNGGNANGPNVPGDLAGLFQEGNTSVTPLGAAFESMYATNTDRYKVYAKKTFKVGQQFALTVPSVPGYENNDFNLTARFTFDVTKYVFKNRHIMYDDQNTNPMNFDMGSLCCWVTWQPAVGALNHMANMNQESFYTVQFVSYGMYEDA